MSWSDDRLYFDAVLAELSKEVRRRTGEDASWVVERVRERLTHGAELYGAQAFLDRDNMPEAEDEYADGVSYPLFELRKRTLSRDGISGEAAQLLFELMVDSVKLSLKARRVRFLLRHPE